MNFGAASTVPVNNIITVTAAKIFAASFISRQLLYQEECQQSADKLARDIKDDSD